MAMTPSGTVKMVGDKPPVRIPDASSLLVRILVDVTSVEVFLNDGERQAQGVGHGEGRVGRSRGRDRQHNLFGRRAPGGAASK